MNDKMVFISHRHTNREIAGIIEQFFVLCGIPYDIIYCSSLPGNDTKQVISTEIKSAIKTSKVDVIILSDEFYQSAYCQNEAGVIWYKDNSIKLLICLPDIREDTMQGFLNKDFTIRRLDKMEDICLIIDLIRPIFPDYIIQSTAIINRNIEQLIKEYTVIISNRMITSKLPTVANNIDINEYIRSGFSDEEMILLMYIIDNKKISLLAGSFATQEADEIMAWEEKFHIDRITRTNYSKVLKLFVAKGFLEVSAIVPPNNPKEYTIKESILKRINNINETSTRKINAVILKHRIKEKGN